MTTTLMDRARATLRTRLARGATLAIVPLAIAAQAQALPSFNSDGGTSKVGFGSTFLPASGGAASDSVVDPGTNSHMKLVGHLNTDAGTVLDNGSLPIEFQWTGSLNGLFNVGDTVTQAYDFQITTAGSSTQQVSWELVSNVEGSRFDAKNSFTGTGTSPFSGTAINTFSVPGTDTAWATSLIINWTGFSLNDTLSILIPTNSIDLTLAAAGPGPVPGSVPEPATALCGLMVLGSLGGFCTRRRRIC